MKTGKKMEPQKLHGEYQEAYQNMALYLDTFTLTYVEKKRNSRRYL